MSDSKITITEEHKQKSGRYVKYAAQLMGGVPALAKAMEVQKMTIYNWINCKPYIISALRAKQLEKITNYRVKFKDLCPHLAEESPS
jgi:YdaS antitoxin of YdaST toxin-antitoxin system